MPEAYHLNNDLRPAILDQRLFDYDFLSAIPGFDKSRNRLLRNPRLQRFYDFLSPRNAFSGANSCAWRHDVLEVGGFDESMAYGGEDLNMGLRLNNIGVRGVRARHSIVSLHLDHGRGYYDAALHQANQEWNKEVRSQRHVFPACPHPPAQTVGRLSAARVSRLCAPPAQIMCARAAGAVGAGGLRWLHLNPIH